MVKVNFWVGGFKKMWDDEARVFSGKSVDEVLKRDHLNESYWAVLSFITLLNPRAGKMKRILHSDWLPILIGYFFLLVSFKYPQSGWFKLMYSLRKQPTLRDTTTSFPAKWRLRNERRNSIVMTRHYPYLGNAADWSCGVKNFLQLIKNTIPRSG